MLGIFLGFELTVTWATLGVTFFTTGAKLVTVGPCRVTGFASTVTWTGETLPVPSDAPSSLLNARPDSPIARAAINVIGLKIFFFIQPNMPKANDTNLSRRLHLCNEVRANRERPPQSQGAISTECWVNAGTHVTGVDSVAQSVD